MVSVGVAIGWIYIAPALALVIGNSIGGALMKMDGIAGPTGNVEALDAEAWEQTIATNLNSQY